MTDIRLTWEQLDRMVNKLAIQVIGSGIEFSSVYGEPRGGLIVAVMLSHRLKLPLVFEWNLKKDTLLVDDVVETGKTLSGMNEAWKVASLFWNTNAEFEPDFYVEKKGEDWVVFPWEHDE